MNKAYQLVWNESNQTWRVVGEKAKVSGRRILGAAIASATFSLLLSSPAAWSAPAPSALPTSGQIVAGQATISQAGSIMYINQTSNSAAVNWNTFNIGSDATVNFHQPSATSVTLNRIDGGNASEIFGQMNANGQVFLTNPNGVYFAPNASVNVGALLATTHAINTDDFMAGAYNFDRDGASGSIINDAELTASIEGFIALLAPQVRNQGVIVADLGSVALAAGEHYQLQIDSNGTLTNLQIEPSTIDALVENGNAIRAQSGLIIMSALSVNALQGGVINNTGIVEATGLVNDGGRVILEASDSITHTGSIYADAKSGLRGNGGSVTLIADLNNADSQTNVNGTISAQGSDLGGVGGFIETSASHLNIGDETHISTISVDGHSGTWLLDPVDFTIAASGGDITGATLSTNLDTGNVTIASTSGSTGTAGDVNVNDVVSWSANTLTLNAQNDININAAMTGTDTAILALEYGQAAVAAGNTADITTTNGTVNLPAGTANFTTKLGSDGTVKNYTVITSLGAAGSTTATDLQGMSGGLSTNYVLGADIDATATSTWNDNGSGGFYGFLPVGTFSGIFDGLGHTISNLYINRPASYYVGLFGYTSSPIIRNIGILNADITGYYYVGALAGRYQPSAAKLSNAYSTGAIESTYSSTTGYGTGGLIGGMLYVTGTNLYSTASVTAGGPFVGGLVGMMYQSSLVSSYATGAVTAPNFGGGLVGYLSNTSSIDRSYATGAVAATTNRTGGLVGEVSSSTISNSYATGNVSGTSVAGLVSYLGSGSTISNSFSTGLITASSSGHGLLTSNYGTVTNSFWDTETSGKATSNGGTGKTTAEMKTEATFTDAGWDFASTPIWYMDTDINNGYASLSGVNYGTLYVRVSNGTTTSVSGSTPGITYALYTAATGGTVVSGGSGTASWTIATPTAASNAGTYTLLYASGVTRAGNYRLQAGDAVNWVITKAPAASTTTTVKAPPQFETRYAPAPIATSKTVTTKGLLVTDPVARGVSVSLQSMPQLGLSGIIVVNVPEGTSNSKAGLSFTLPKEVNNIVKDNSGKAIVTLPSGEELPSWLTFDTETLTLTTDADATFPIEITVTSGNEQFTIVVLENALETIQ